MKLFHVISSLCDSQKHIHHIATKKKKKKKINKILIVHFETPIKTSFVTKTDPNYYGSGESVWVRVTNVNVNENE